jgi:hypothetical protein
VVPIAAVFIPEFIPDPEAILTEIPLVVPLIVCSFTGREAA